MHIIDWSAAAAYIAALYDDTTADIIVQTFTDNKQQKEKDKAAAKVAGTQYRDPLATVLRGTIESEALRSKLQELQNAGAGVFIQINPGTARGKAHITGIQALWVDCDDPHTPSIQIARELMPAPTLLVTSSPGKSHVYWRVTDCALDAFPLAQRALAAAMRADMSMCNLDRVLRLPGTWHLKGEPFKVALISARPVCYASHALIGAATARSTPDTLIGAMQMVAKKFELPQYLEPGTRTSTLISYIGQLATKGYSSEYIHAAVRTANVERCGPGVDPIDEGTLEAEIFPAIERYALTATPQATTEPIAPPTSEDLPGGWEALTAITAPGSLDGFLRQYVYIELGPRVADLSRHPIHAVYSLQEFRAAHQNKQVGESTLANLWMQSADRLDVRDTAYLPGSARVAIDGGHSFFNTYTDSGLTKPLAADPAKVAPWLEHIDYLFESNAAAIARFLSWAAMTVQRPTVRVPWVPLIVSTTGTGKGWLYESFKKILGGHNCALISADDLSDRKSSFNEFMSGTLLVCIGELRTSHKWDDMERLKLLITEPELMINHKFGTKKQEKVYCNFLAFSNHDAAAALKANDRRFWVQKCSGAARSAEYYSGLFAWLQSDGPAHLLTYLSQYDISTFAFGETPPMTQAKLGMIAASRSLYEQLIMDAIEDRSGIFRCDVIDAKIVEEYIQATLNIDKLSTSDRHHIRMVLSDVSTGLPQDRYRIQYGQTISARVRCRAVRDHSRWALADAQEIIDEYTRALSISLGASGRSLHAASTKTGD